MGSLMEYRSREMSHKRIIEDWILRSVLGKYQCEKGKR